MTDPNLQQCAKVQTTRGYLVLATAYPRVIGEVIHDSAGVGGQPVRVVGPATHTEWVDQQEAQNQAVAQELAGRLSSLAYFYRVETD